MTRYAPLTSNPARATQDVSRQRDAAFGQARDQAAGVPAFTPNLASGVGAPHGVSPGGYGSMADMASLNTAMQQMLHFQALQRLASGMQAMPYTALAQSAPQGLPSLAPLSNGLATQAQRMANQPSANTLLANGMSAQAQRLANQQSPLTFQQFLQQLAAINRS